MRKHKAGGFTLVEMLVVMSIIMIMAVMVVPMYSRFRSGSQIVSCQANLRGIGLALHTYASEYNRWLPYTLDTGKEQTEDAGRAIRWKYELSYYMGNYGQQERKDRSYPLHPGFFDPVPGRTGKGTYMLSKRQFGARVQVYARVNVGGSWVMQWTDYTAPSKEKYLPGQHAAPDGFMHMDWWKSATQAAIIGPSRDPRVHRALGRQGEVVNIEYRHRGKANILFLDQSVRIFEQGDEELFKHFDHKELQNNNMRQLDDPR